jgi:hypothetical protein
MEHAIWPGIGLAAALALGSHGAASARAAAAQDEAGLRAQFDALAERLDEARAQFGAAMSELFAGWDAASEPERAEIEAKAKALQAERDPSARFAAAFRALAERARGDEVARASWIQALELAASAGSTPASFEIERAAFAALLTDWRESEELADVAWTCRYAAPLPRGERVETLAKLESASPHADVKAAARCVRAMILMEGGDAADLAESRRLFTSLAAEFGDSFAPGMGPFSEVASAHVFEIDHLQLGMVAPDFDARDANAAPFRLADYRGKVVALDFWGFW